MACLIECVITGSTQAGSVHREKVRRILQEKPTLASRIAASRERDDCGVILWQPDRRRVENVILKLARGHAACEIAELQLEDPELLLYMPLSVMPENQRQSFEAPREEWLYPEIGSRAFQEIIVTDPFSCQSDWQIVQLGRYRYSQLLTLPVRLVPRSFEWEASTVTSR